MDKSFLRFVLMRSLVLLISLLLFASLLFAVFWIPNESPILVPRTGDIELINMVKDELKLDEPLIIQYLNALYRMLTFDFFSSSGVRPYMDVSDLVGDAVPWTIIVLILSVLSSSAIGGGLAWVANRTGSRALVALVKGVSVVCLCLPLPTLAIYYLMMLNDYSLLPSHYDEARRLWWSLISVPVVTLVTFGMFALASTRPIPSSRNDHVPGREHRLCLLLTPTMLSFFVVYSMACVLAVDLFMRFGGLGTLLWDGLSGRDFQVVVSCAYTVFFILAIALFSIDVLGFSWGHRGDAKQGLSDEPRTPVVERIDDTTTSISAQPAVRSNWCKDLMRAYSRHILGVLALAGILAMAVMTLLAQSLSTVPEPWAVANLEPNDPDTDRFNPFPPSWERSPSTGFLHPLGTDNIGSDMYSQLLYGARVPLAVALGSASLSLALGFSALACIAYISRRRGILWKIPTSISLVLSEAFLALPLLLSVGVLSVGVAMGSGSLVLFSIIWVSLFAWAPIWKDLRSHARYSMDAAALSSESRPFGEIFRESCRRNAWLVVRLSKFVAIAVFASYIMSYIFWHFHLEWSNYTWAEMLYRAFVWDAFVRGAWWAIVPVSFCITALGICVYAARSTLETVVRPSGSRD